MGNGNGNGNGDPASDVEATQEKLDEILRRANDKDDKDHNPEAK
jgi:hypothetical protein